MARGRMISATLGESRKYAALNTDTARVLFPLIVANTDKSGRLEADTQYVTRKLCVLLPYDQDAVEDALQDLHRVNLIILYTKNDRRYLQVVKFLEHNAPNYQEPDSDIPPPAGYTQDGEEIGADANKRKSNRGKKPSGTNGNTEPAPREHHARQVPSIMPGKREASPRASGPEKEVEGEGEVEEKENNPSPPTPPTEHASNRDAPEMRGEWGGQKTGKSILLHLARSDPGAHKDLERLAAAARWKFAQKVEAAEALLANRERALDALTRTFDLLEGLKFPFAFFKKTLIDTPTRATPNSNPAREADAEWEELMRAAKEGDLDTLNRLTA